MRPFLHQIYTTKNKDDRSKASESLTSCRHTQRQKQVGTTCFTEKMYIQKVFPRPAARASNVIWEAIFAESGPHL